MVAKASTENFVELLRISGLDPALDLRFFDWSGVDFSWCDLRGFDFTGANLMDCRFEGALIQGTRFDGAQMHRIALRESKDWREYRRAWKRLSSPPCGQHLPDLSVFSDAPFAPELVVLPAGEFVMGSQDDDEYWQTARPQHRVTIGYRFAIGRYPVTYDEYDYFCEMAMKGSHQIFTGVAPSNQCQLVRCASLLCVAVPRDWTALSIAERGGMGVCLSGRHHKSLCVRRRDHAEGCELLEK